MIINSLVKIKFKICLLLGRSNCGEEISEKPSLFYGYEVGNSQSILLNIDEFGFQFERFE